MNRYAVLGDPIQQSLSPLIFQLFAAQTGQTLSYEAILMRPEALSAGLPALYQQGYRGLNLTAPLKEKAFSLVTACSEAARLAKAINMLSFREDGSCYGDNSDGLGFIRDLSLRKHFSIRNKTILVLGAGGAVRGLMATLLAERPEQLVLSNRSEAKAKQLIQDFQGEGSSLFFSPWGELSAYRFDFVLQATTAAEPGQPFPLPAGILKKDACCYDLVYGKRHFPFLSWAKEQGAVCFDGLGMLVEQAAVAFALWQQKPVDTGLALEKLLHLQA